MATTQIVQKLDFLTKTPVWIEKIAIGVLIILACWIIGAIVKKIILKIPRGASEKRYVFKLIADFCKISIILLGIITALGTIGINVTAIVASLGLTGFAIGFALKDYLSSILAGLMVMIYQPYRIGDTITVAGATGKVREINLRYTVLTTVEKDILIPNSSMINSTISISH
ncbi:MAG: mechanosensitive ion channel [Gammaproteobacteria bacterium]